MLRLHVAHMRYAGRGLVGIERREVRISAAIEADHGKVEPLVRTHDLAVTLRRGPDRGSGRSRRGRRKKLPSSNHPPPWRLSERLRQAAFCALRLSRPRLARSLAIDCGVFAAHELPVAQPGPALRYCWVMPIADLQQAAQKIAGFLSTLNKLGGLRLKYRITAGDGARDPRASRPAIYVELAGPDTPLVTQHNGELLRALETIAAQILRLDQREHDLVSFDAGNFKALRAQELRLQAEIAADKVHPLRHALCLSAHEQPRAPPAAHGLPRH